MTGQSSAARREDAVCEAYYGTGEPSPNGAAVCARPMSHPPYSEDGIGHSPRPAKGDVFGRHFSDEVAT